MPEVAIKQSHSLSLAFQDIRPFYDKAINPDFWYIWTIQVYKA
jgi:hypothetical protein